MRSVISASMSRGSAAFGGWLSDAARGPAPSRWAYKAQRIWLTPLFRQTLKVGIPAYAIVFGIGLAVQDGAPAKAVTGAAVEMWEGLKARPEFAVSSLQVAGASPRIEGEIREALSDTLPISTFDLQLEPLQERIAGLGAVARADFALAAGGVLAVTVTERPPALLWRVRGGGLAILDAEGVEIGRAEARADHAELPLVVGDGAPDDAATAIALMEAAGTLAPRMRGLVRVGQRRWDAVLEGDLRIMLPEEGAPEAMRRVAAMDRAEDLLERDILHVDMRIAERATVRLSSAGRRARDEMIELARLARSGE